MQTQSLVLFILLFTNCTNYLNSAEAPSTDTSGSVATKSSDSDSVKIARVDGCGGGVPPRPDSPIPTDQADLDRWLLSKATVISATELSLQTAPDSVKKYAHLMIDRRTYRDTALGCFNFGCLAYQVRINLSDSHSDADPYFPGDYSMVLKHANQRYEANETVFKVRNKNLKLGKAFKEFYAGDWRSGLSKIGPELKEKVIAEYCRPDAYDEFKIMESLHAGPLSTDGLE